MARWLRLETDMVDHPKTGRLAARLGEPLAGWYVVRALAWMSRFCPVGHVRDSDGTSLESSAEWRGEPGKLLAALVDCGWLDAVDDGWEWHDWADHQGKVAHKASKERERKAAYRARVSQTVPRDNDGTSHGTSAGRPAQRDVTLRDVTLREKQHVEDKPRPSVKVIDDDSLTVDERDVWRCWRVECRHPRAVLTADRLKLIRKWLPVYGVERLQAAILGCARSPHHQGQNDRNTRYDSLELILRDAKHIEMFEGINRGAA